MSLSSRLLAWQCHHGAYCNVFRPSSIRCEPTMRRCGLAWLQPLAQSSPDCAWSTNTSPCRVPADGVISVQARGEGALLLGAKPRPAGDLSWSARLELKPSTDFELHLAKKSGKGGGQCLHAFMCVVVCMCIHVCMCTCMCTCTCT